MHDIKYIRENPEAFDAALKRRGSEPFASTILDLDKKHRADQTAAEGFKAQRNKLSAQYGQAKSQGDTSRAQSIMDQIKSLADAAPDYEGSGSALYELLISLPNLPANDAPTGLDENDNLELTRIGTPRSFDFTPRDHADIGPALGLDFETGVALSGSRFTFMRGQMARLNRALGQFMLDQHTMSGGYSECATPYIVKDEAMFGTGQLPKFAEDSFETDISLDVLDYIEFKQEHYEKARNDGLLSQNQSITDRKVWDELPSPPTRRWLIPTAEVSLTNSVAGQILEEAQLPVRLTALTPCFRSEAGAAGKDTKGLIRQHQFEKVELVTITCPEDSEAEHEHLTASAEGILQALGLPYRKMLLCTGDMGASARKTYDLEVWLPGQGLYREISSCSNCGDWQARRMNARYRPAEGKGTVFVHTLNGSGLAVGRTLVAVLENYQEADGSVTVPTALLSYMGGLERLVPQIISSS